MIKLIKKILFEQSQNFINRKIKINYVVDNNNYLTVDFVNDTFIMRLSIHEEDYIDLEKYDLKMRELKTFKSINLKEVEKNEALEIIKQQIYSENKES